MATTGQSEYRSVTDQIRLAQNSHSADSASQPSPLQMSLRRPSKCQPPTAIPKPSLEKPSSRRRYSRTSSVSSLKSSSGPSRSWSPDSSPVSSVREVSITDAEVKEPEPNLPKAPEHFTRAFSIPKTLFDIYETSREWHFGFTPMQNVHALKMELNEANLKREKAEQQVRDLTQRLSSVAEPGPKIQSSESERKCSEGANVTPSKLRKERDARLKELIEKKGKIPLKKRFEELVGWCQKIEADIDAAQDRNMLLFDELGEASKDITRLKNEKLLLESNKEKLKKQLEQSRKQTTVANDDQTSAIPISKPPQPLAPQNDQENRLGELQRENERLRLENDVMRNGLEQPQSQDSPPEEPETQLNDVTPEVAQAWSADRGVEVQGADANIGGITAGQDSVGPQDIEVTVIPVTPPAASEARETLHADEIFDDTSGKDDESRGD
ncbi:hypothetical protein FCIRC_1706 [Fusarium circinatum]|uniref:Uncharacterized protein n=1 Tax=Fusarium circinatum TaxID=48490 RepID=A0A8H5UJ77_FUSCI|nr:hypothetical protein FCIRC_1706 [Fusarium circinatum]